LVGTGPWAEVAHGPGLVATDNGELVGVWGRDPGKAAILAGKLDTVAYASYEDLLEVVDAVAFCVPPAVQAPMAIQAARAGKHLLLEKPIAMEVAEGRELVEAVTNAGVASVVLFTDRFVPEVRDWIAEVEATGGWLGGITRWFSALQQPDNPFGDSPWRHQYGGLWDTNPHVISTLTATLGPIDSVIAAKGAGDLVHLVFHHQSGATSTASLDQFAPPAVEGFVATLWGTAGFTTMPERIGLDRVWEPVAVAAAELMECAATSTTHPVDVQFGQYVLEIIDSAASYLARDHPTPNP
jgi:predicted dehydrogenase